MLAGNEIYDAFISYSRADSRHAAEIDSILRDKSLKPFFDRRNLDPGLPWLRALEKAIGSSKTAIVLIGPNGFGNTQQYERELAIIRQTREPAFRVIPVILPKNSSDLPFDFIQNLTWIDFSQVEKVTDSPDELQRLLKAVQGGLPADEEARQAICPWRGLDAFREEDSAFFFGRGSMDEPESPIGQLLRKVREHSFVMVVGRSGSGKSSLVFAGLLPALRRERNQFWTVLSLRPGTGPLQAIAEVFNPKPTNEGAVAYASRITEDTEKLRCGGPDVLGTMAKQYLQSAEGKPDRLLLYIDQWEELYAQALSSSDKEKATGPVSDVSLFIDLLLTAVRTAPVTIVGTVRADFYDPLIGHEGMRALLPTCQVLLAHMSRSELESTIVGPAGKVGLAFDPPTLVARILDEAGEDEGMLPLLQYALKESWALRKGNKITADSYDRAGGVREAIRSMADRTFDALSEKDQRSARQLFLRLVTPGEGKEDTRARAAMPSEPMQRRIVEQFAGPRTRLLVTGSDRAARPTVELAHEALIRTWPRLRGWIDASREKLRARAAVLQAKAQWEQQGGREDLLLPAGFQLERARALMAEPGDISVADIHDFIALSFAREERERKEREDALARDEARVAEIRAAQDRTAAALAEKEDAQASTAAALAEKEAAQASTAVALGEKAAAQASTAVAQARTARWQRITRWAFAAVGAVILIAGATIGYLQSNNARQLAAKGQQLATQAEELASQQTALTHGQANVLAELSATKLLRGEFDSALRLASHGTRTDLALPSDVVKASPAAAALAAAVSAANWRSALGGHDDGLTSAAFSPDGSRIVTASMDKTARIWDAATATEIAVLRGHDDWVSSAAFSPEGSRIVTASLDKTARIWDAATATEIAVLRGHDGNVNSAAFSPEGSRIVTASGDGTARIWDAATATEIAILRGHDDSVSSAAFSPDGSRIVTASADKTARIWDATTAMEIAVLRGHELWLTSAAFGPDGSRIVTASADNTARIWDAATAREITVLRGHDQTVRLAAFSPDGSRIITALDDDNSAHIWDAATAEEIAILRGHDRSVSSAAFSPDGSRIVTASDDKTARIWGAATATEIAVLRGHDGNVNSAAFSPDGSRIVTASGDKTVRIWGEGNEVSTARAWLGVRLRSLTPAIAPTLRPNIIAGALVIEVAPGGPAAKADLGNGDVITSMDDVPVHDAQEVVQRVGSMAPGTSVKLGVIHEGREQTLALILGTFREPTIKAIAVLRGHDDGVNSAAFSPDGSRIVTASGDKTARIWDAATAKEIAILRGR
jgi:WD40 repeat protein